jgi:hypothetical protein
MAKNPYAQVALTYLRRPFSSVISFLAVLGFFFMGVVSMIQIALMQRKPYGDQQTPFNAMFWSGTGSFFATLAVHIKDQFTDPRAHLTPTFRRAHLTVAGGAFFIFAVLLPGTATCLAGVHSIGLLAVSVLLYGAAFWLVMSPNSSINWLLALSMFALLTKQGNGTLMQLCIGQFEPQAYALLVLGAFAIFNGVKKLLSLDEDMPEYLLMTTVGRKRMAHYQREPVSAFVPAKITERYNENQMAKLAGHVRRAAVSRWSRVCRWQVGMVTGSPILFMGLIFFFIFDLSTLMVEQKNVSFLFIAMFISFMPALVMGGNLFQKRIRTLQYELSLPVDRATYLKQMGLAAALNQFQLWGVMSVLMYLYLQIISAQLVSLSFVYIFIYSTLYQVWMFGMVVWLLRLRSLILAILGYVLSNYLVLIPLGAMEKGPMASWRNVMLLVPALFAVFGLLLTWDAYRRWLKTDIE